MLRAAKNYLHRFSPWIALTWKERSVRKLDREVRSPAAKNRVTAMEDEFISLLEHMDEELK
jgi:hypothetical protein